VFNSRFTLGRKHPPPLCPIAGVKERKSRSSMTKAMSLGGKPTSQNVATLPVVELNR